MPEVTAKMLFEYDRRMYAPGDKLVVEERFVRILVTLGRINPPEPPPPRDAAGQTYRTTAIASAPSTKDEKPAVKRTRNRESLVGARRP